MVLINHRNSRRKNNYLVYHGKNDLLINQTTSLKIEQISREFAQCKSEGNLTRESRKIQIQCRERIAGHSRISDINPYHEVHDVLIHRHNAAICLACRIQSPPPFQPV